MHPTKKPSPPLTQAPIIPMTRTPIQYATHPGILSESLEFVVIVCCDEGDVGLLDVVGDGRGLETRIETPT